MSWLSSGIAIGFFMFGVFCGVGAMMILLVAADRHEQDEQRHLSSQNCGERNDINKCKKQSWRI